MPAAEPKQLRNAVHASGGPYPWCFPRRLAVLSTREGCGFLQRSTRRPGRDRKYWQESSGLCACKQRRDKVTNTLAETGLKPPKREKTRGEKCRQQGAAEHKYLARILRAAGCGAQQPAGSFVSGHDVINRSSLQQRPVSWGFASPAFHGKVIVRPRIGTANARVFF